MQDLHFFKDKVNIELKDMKINFEVGLRNLSDQKTAIERNLKDYVNEIFSVYKIEKENEMNDIRESIKNTKIENGKYHLEAMKVVNHQKQIIDEYNSMSEGLIANWKDGIQTIKENNTVYAQIKKTLKLTEDDHSDIYDELKVILL